ncbi:MAG TPA: hypothetical protein VJ023_10650 [Pyrinomonadaceae bacterium]|nr:hypothetical protein [Pyrinomonadaceae bacterium]
MAPHRHSTVAALRGHNSYVLRPITAVSNSLNSAAKPMAGSITIQSYSPFGPGNEAI